VDSDDWLEIDALEVLYHKQQETNAEIVNGGIRYVFASKTAEFKFEQTPETVSPLLHFFLLGKGYLCGRLYNRSLFNDCFFPDSNVCEDLAVNVQVFSKITDPQKIQVVDTIIYNYDQCSGGILFRVHKIPCASYKDFPSITACLWIEDYLKKLPCGAAEMSAFIRLFLLNIISYLRFNNKRDKKDAKFL
jgi:hypothetical protein